MLKQKVRRVVFLQHLWPLQCVRRALNRTLKDGGNGDSDGDGDGDGNGNGNGDGDGDDDRDGDGDGEGEIHRREEGNLNIILIEIR